MQKFDLHMHTTYCDGKNSAEEMILAAIDMGLEAVGISGHSYTWYDESYCMSREGTLQYIEEINSLKKKYADRIKVLLGTELDYWSDIDVSPYDYLIGSSHYVLRDDVYLDIDYYAELLMKEVHEHYGGDVLGICEDYYKQMGNMVKKTGCDIIGHFDLVTKFIEKYALDENGNPVEIGREKGLHRLIETGNPRYLAAWKKAVDQIFEDTKALRRGESFSSDTDISNDYFSTMTHSSLGSAFEHSAITSPNRLERLGILHVGDKPVFEINTGAIAKGNRTYPYPAPDQIEYIKSKGGILIYSSDAHSPSHICCAFNENC